MLFQPSRRDLLRYGSFAGAGALLPGSALAAADPWQRAADIARTVRAPVFPARVFDITQFGAKGDGATLNTDSIAKSIAACAAAGGGRVHTERVALANVRVNGKVVRALDQLSAS